MSQAPSKTPGGPQSTVLEKTKPAGKLPYIVGETGKKDRAEEMEGNRGGKRKQNLELVMGQGDTELVTMGTGR